MCGDFRWPEICDRDKRSKEARVSLTREILIAVMMIALLLVYRVHPVAGWSMLTMLAPVAIRVGHRRKARA